MGGSGDASITNTIIWNNSQDHHISDDYDVTYSDIADDFYLADPTTNINEDPMFVDPDNGDYHLQAGSPCINAGTSNGAPDDDLEGNTRDGSPDMGAYEFGATVVDADIDIKPDTLNLKSKGKWITAYIELPEGYHANDIVVSSIWIEGEITVEHSDMQDSVLMVKFDRQELKDYLGETTGDVTLTVSGELTDGTPFEGSDTIKVINNGKK
ncbi:choice-of-anchor Q domain-containing protein [Chloroflexota bacterium]